MSEHYGEQWRRWPGGCPCHRQGAGYFMNYRNAFDSVFDVVDGRYFLMVAAEGDADEVWGWRYGAFSWTPDGDLLETIGSGTNATRARAETACRESAVNFAARVAAL